MSKKKISTKRINDAIDAGRIINDNGAYDPYAPWQNHINSATRMPFLVTGDRMKRGRFNYTEFDRVIRFIDPGFYRPLKQVACVQWGSSAEDLRDILVLINSVMGNYLDAIFVVSITTNQQAGWYLRGNAHSPKYPHASWHSYLPNLTHTP